MMRTSNPALNPSIFAGARADTGSGAMTIQGTVNKCFILFFLLLLSASWVWGKLMQPVPVFGDEAAAGQSAAMVMPFIIGGAIAGLILAMVTIFKLPWAKFTAPAYALCEGLVLGGISALFEKSYPGIVIQAVALTFGTLFCMLALYKSRIIKVTDKFRMGVASATGAIFLVYFVGWILSFFGRGIPMIHGSGMIGIGFSLLVVGIAALNLVLDFDIIEKGAQQGAPRYMEWYGAFVLMVTLIWLYMEILRLLAKLRGRR